MYYYINGCTSHLVTPWIHIFLKDTINTFNFFGALLYFLANSGIKI